MAQGSTFQVYCVPDHENRLQIEGRIYLLPIQGFRSAREAREVTTATGLERLRICLPAQTEKLPLLRSKEKHELDSTAGQLEIQVAHKRSTKVHRLRWVTRTPVVYSLQ